MGEVKSRVKGEELRRGIFDFIFGGQKAAGADSNLARVKQRLPRSLPLECSSDFLRRFHLPSSRSVAEHCKYSERQTVWRQERRQITRITLDSRRLRSEAPSANDRHAVLIRPSRSLSPITIFFSNSQQGDSLSNAKHCYIFRSALLL